MKTLLTSLLLFISVACSAQSQDYFSVNVSVDNYKNRPALVFSQHGINSYLILRTPKGDFNYTLKNTGVDMMGGITAATYSVHDKKGLLSGFSFCHYFGENVVDNNKKVNYIHLKIKDASSNHVLEQEIQLKEI